MSVTKDQVFEFIDNMSVLDMSKFIKEFEERYGVTAAAPVAMAAAPAAGGAAPAAAEEKTSFDVILASSGDKKPCSHRDINTPPVKFSYDCTTSKSISWL